MAFNATNPVTVGAATKKDHYDRVFANTVLLKTSISDDGRLAPLDTDSSHRMPIVCGSNLTAERILTMAPGDAARTITLSGNPTLADWFDQAVKAASTPAFNGIIFPATQVPSANANALDDCERGSWTPSDQSGAGLTFVLDAANNKYVKFGRLVIVSFRVQWPATANEAAATLGGLPFTVLTSANSLFGGSLSISTEATATTLLVTSGSTTMTVRTQAAGTISNAAMSGDIISGALAYFTDL